jgi:hypothetical protein
VLVFQIYQTLHYDWLLVFPQSEAITAVNTRRNRIDAAHRYIMIIPRGRFIPSKIPYVPHMAPCSPKLYPRNKRQSRQVARVRRCCGTQLQLVVPEASHIPQDMANYHVRRGILKARNSTNNHNQTQGTPQVRKTLTRVHITSWVSVCTRDAASRTDCRFEACLPEKQMDSQR